MKSFRFIFVVHLILFFAQGCISIQETRNDAIPYGIRVEYDDSKTTLNSNRLSWASNDALGFYAGAFQKNVKFSYKDDNQFIGYLTKYDYLPIMTNYCCYYPFSSNSSNSTVYSTLRRRQVAPFDSESDFIVSNLVFDKYNEKEFPSLSFTLSNHLFSIAHIRVINTVNGALNNERIKNIVIKAPGNQIVGDFSFDALKGESADPIFDGINTSDSVILAFPPTSCPIIGLNKTTDFYVVLKEGTYPTLKLTINTNGHRAIMYSSVPTTFSRGTITSLPVVDLSSINIEQTHSYTYDAYLLGDSIFSGWASTDAQYFKTNHYTPSGIPGETTSQMLARFKSAAPSADCHCFVLLGGTNDIAQNQGYISNEDIMKNIVEMAEIATKNNMHPLLCSVLPVSQYSWNTSVVPMPIIKDLNSRIKAYCDSSNAIYVDLYSEFVNSEGTGPKDGLTTDGVHPTAAGYKILGSIIDQHVAAVNYSF